MAVTVTDWIAYAAARGDVVEDDAASASALIRATDYITFHHVNRFMAGYDATSPNVDEATYEAAKLELATPGFFSKTFTPAEQRVLVEVKGIKWERVGDATGSEAATPVSTKIEAMLSPYINRVPGAFTV
ncbi:hypothetical protein QEZ52_00315 [Aliisedimentitalea scapharcae]|uniref:Uncharacterized protein n=1 Tax=Aliisedimentitalea scapharcae TaxID=1524259 RepID=A0ABZ2XUP0_9RHOB